MVVMYNPQTNANRPFHGFKFYTRKTIPAVQNVPDNTTSPLAIGEIQNPRKRNAKPAGHLKSDLTLPEFNMTEVLPRKKHRTVVKQVQGKAAVHDGILQRPL